MGPLEVGILLVAAAGLAGIGVLVVRAARGHTGANQTEAAAPRRKEPDPDPVLLANGDVLVPDHRGAGEPKMVRLGPGDPSHAEWVTYIQRGGRVQTDGGLITAGWLTALFLPIVGFIIGIILAARGRPQGGWIMVLSVVIMVIAINYL